MTFSEWYDPMASQSKFKSCYESCRGLAKAAWDAALENKWHPTDSQKPKIVATVRIPIKGRHDILRFALRSLWAWVRYRKAVLVFPRVELEILQEEKT